MLYIRRDLVKGDDRTGEQRSGAYAARVRLPKNEKDGSPSYKYFDSLEARDKYLNREKYEGEERLKEKLSDEHKDTKHKQESGHSKVESGQLFVGGKKEKTAEAKKSLSVFIWRLE